MSFLFFILLIVSNTKSTSSPSTSTSRSAIVFFLPFYATIFTTLSIACKPCRIHPGRVLDWPETGFPRPQRTSFCLSFSPGHKATRGSLQAAIIIEGRKEKKQTFRHPRRTVRLQPEPEPAPVLFFFFFSFLLPCLLPQLS